MLPGRSDDLLGAVASLFLPKTSSPAAPVLRAPNRCCVCPSPPEPRWPPAKPNIWVHIPQTFPASTRPSWGMEQFHHRLCKCPEVGWRITSWNCLAAKPMARRLQVVVAPRVGDRPRQVVGPPGSDAAAPAPCELDRSWRRRNIRNSRLQSWHLQC